MNRHILWRRKPTVVRCKLRRPTWIAIFIYSRSVFLRNRLLREILITPLLRSKGWVCELCVWKLLLYWDIGIGCLWGWVILINGIQRGEDSVVGDT